MRYIDYVWTVLYVHEDQVYCSLYRCIMARTELHIWFKGIHCMASRRSTIMSKTEQLYRVDAEILITFQFLYLRNSRFSTTFKTCRKVLYSVYEPKHYAMQVQAFWLKSVIATFNSN